METAVFGGGCFWCTEAVFTNLKGVEKAEPGYAGGSKEHPTYEDVSSGKTGHAEVIRITYDPKEIHYRDLLTVFFATHDPTTLNRQGNDVGPQYRSIVLYTNEKQKQDAAEYIQDIQSSITDGTRVTTSLEELGQFWPAEDYHKQYYEKNKNAQYCMLVIEPKLQKVSKEYAELLRTKALA